MIDTPNSCQARAAFSRARAANSPLAATRLRHLADAEIWEGLAAVLQGRRGPQTPVPDIVLCTAIVEAKRARRGAGGSARPGSALLQGAGE